jgi:hypothetical protein
MRGREKGRNRGKFATAALMLLSAHQWFPNFTQRHLLGLAEILSTPSFLSVCAREEQLCFSFSFPK